MPQTSDPRSPTQSLQQYARGVTGGLIFSLPLLYTMEIWWAGFNSSPQRLMLYMVSTFVLLLGYNRYAGLRANASFGEVVIDSVEEMGLGLIVAALTLFLLGQLTSEMSSGEIIGKIVMEAMTVAIGISVGTAQLGSGEEESGQDNSNQEEGNEEDEKQPRFHEQLVITVCGAVLFAANVAPTEEVMVLGLETSSLRLMGVVLLSLALSALILYGSDFRGAQRFASRDGRFPVLRGVIVSYGVALVSSAVILWFFGRFENTALLPSLKQTVALGLPAALGASGGRLLLQAP